MIIATAGHVDHGKTALVKALTGVDTDRLPQEKARGISIDLGFAYANAPGGGSLGFVDVPGHERFVRNMLAGVCGIDCVLLLVAADDGVMPQTREHLAIIDLLGVTRGIVVISKVDAVSPQRVDDVRHEIASLVAYTSIADAPVMAVSTITGEGVAALRARLDAEATVAPAAAHAGRGFRHAIDRVFTVAGSGTVVTGTVFDGSVVVGDHLLLSPSGTPVRVRGIQKAGVAAASARAGERCALNLAGVDVAHVQRGDMVVAVHTPTQRIDVRLRLLADAPAPLRHWTPVHVHVGTAAVSARVAIRGGVQLAPGDTGIVQLQLDRAVALGHGDHCIVRDASATRTLGGGVVVDPQAPARRMAPALRAQQLAALALPDARAALPALLGAFPSGLQVQRFIATFNLTADHAALLLRDQHAVIIDHGAPVAFAAATVDAVQGAVQVALAHFHHASPQVPGMPIAMLHENAAPAWHVDTFAALLRGSAQTFGIEIAGSLVRRAGHIATANRTDEALWQRLRPRLIEAGFAGVLVRDLAADVRVPEPALSDFMHRLAATGEVVRVSAQRFYPRELMAQLAALATAMVAGASEGAFTAAQFRDRTGINRTLAIELLECLDRIGITQRVGDARKIRKDFVPLLGAAAVPAAPAARRPAPALQPERPPMARHPRNHHGVRDGRVAKHG